MKTSQHEREYEYEFDCESQYGYECECKYYFKCQYEHDCKYEFACQFHSQKLASSKNQHFQESFAVLEFFTLLRFFFFFFLSRGACLLSTPFYPPLVNITDTYRVGKKKKKKKKKSQSRKRKMSDEKKITFCIFEDILPI